jgi:hypothetical protein
VFWVLVVAEGCTKKKVPRRKISGEFWRTADLGSRGLSSAMRLSLVPLHVPHAALDTHPARRCCAHDGAMLDFMENVQHAFYDASHWNVDNSYGALNATARGPALRPIFFQTLC